ncbi:hypothetical protein SDC9_205490 [bioreactor metagenome]
MGGAFAKLGRSLQQSVTHYNSAVGSMETRVLVSARRFRDLQVTEKELQSPQGIEQSARPLSAPELVAEAEARTLPAPSRIRLVQTDPADGIDGTAEELLARSEPTVAELVETDQQAGSSRGTRLDELGS